MIQTRGYKQAAAAIRASPSQGTHSLERAKAIVRLVDEPAFEPRDSEGAARPFAAVDARSLLQHVSERVRDVADAKDVDVIVHCACAQVWVQPEAFAEALYELVANAVAATKRGYPVLVDVRDTEGAVLWQVQDAGDGCRSGFGAAFPAAVIEEHGGVLRFESAPGVGTTSTVRLPARA